MKQKKLLLILFLVICSQAIGQLVTGNVTIDDRPVPGVSVIVKGTTNGVGTNFDGEYTINDVNDGDILSFSYIGFKTVEIVYTGQKEINVALIEDEVSLDEVIIVNYGRQRNTPVSVVTSEVLSEFPVTDLGQALLGRAAGVNVTNGGSPGSQNLEMVDHFL